MEVSRPRRPWLVVWRAPIDADEFDFCGVVAGTMGIFLIPTTTNQLNSLRTCLAAHRRPLLHATTSRSARQRTNATACSGPRASTHATRALEPSFATPSTAASPTTRRLRTAQVRRPASESLCASSLAEAVPPPLEFATTQVAVRRWRRHRRTTRQRPSALACSRVLQVLANAFHSPLGP